jgi:hypothetical protein
VASVIVDSVSHQSKGMKASISLPGITFQENVIFKVTDVVSGSEGKGRRRLSARLHGITSHKIVIFMVSDVRTSTYFIRWVCEDESELSLLEAFHSLGRKLCLFVPQVRGVRVHFV